MQQRRTIERVMQESVCVELLCNGTALERDRVGPVSSHLFLSNFETSDANPGLIRLTLIPPIHSLRLVYLRRLVVLLNCIGLEIM